MHLTVEGDRLCFSAPPGALPPPLRNELVRRKAEIVRRLRQVEGAPAAAGGRLFEPLRLGPLTLRNRIVMSPMEVDLGGRDGTAGERSVAYYAARAKGGAALLVVEATCVDAPAGLVSPYELRADADAFIPGLARLAHAIRAAGAAAVLQLQHAGRKASAAITGCQPVAPSAVSSHGGETPRALAAGEIAALAARYADAAARARLAGFDGVEIHAAHGYLVSQFLSPLYNVRDDEYGGGLAGRARFLYELVAAVRARAGFDYPVFCRLSAADLEVAGEIRPAAGGLTLAEAAVVAQRLAALGVAAIDVSATLVGLPRMHPMSWPEGHLVPAAAAVRRAAGIPVSVTSRVSPELAEQHLGDGSIDLVRLGRALLADPLLPQKLAAGRADEVTPCIFCGLCVDPRARRPEAVCAVNPDLGREGEAAVRPAPARRKQVVVVGGGPAGMEAARVAAQRGHQVRLYEAGPRLGGQLLLSGKPASAARTLDRLRVHLEGQLRRAGVEVHLGHELAAADLAALDADAVVVAAGAAAEPPALPMPSGAGAGAGTLTAAQLLAGAPVGERVVVVGSELVGCEAALYLAERGRRVVLLGRGRDAASRLPADLRAYLVWALPERGVEVICRAEVEEVTACGAVYRDAAGEQRLAVADSVVFATGARPRAGLAAALAGRVAEVFTAGDCNRPRGIREALAEGREVALAL